MRAKRKQSGLTLTELVVVIATMTLLVGVGLPAIRAVVNSFESGDSARGMISAALASARALAATKGHYVGVRFQHAYNPDAADPCDPLTAPQYMVFIIHDSNILASAFRVVEGTKPIKLPDSIGVTDLTIVTDRRPGAYSETRLNADALVDQPHEVRDATSFSIIFSKTGKLVTQLVRVTRKNASDRVFNTKAKVQSGAAMFFQYSALPISLGAEESRKSFVIYDRAKFKGALPNAWSEYLINLAREAIYINPYTGTIIGQ